MKHRLKTGQSRLSALLSKALGKRPQDIDKLYRMLQKAQADRLIDPEVYNIFRRSMRASSKQARDIMVPRPQVRFLRAESSLDDWIDQIVSSKHSRYPVVDGSLDKVVGMLLPKDLLPYMRSDSGQTMPKLETLLRTPYFVPESQRMHELLANFRKRRSHLALVMDEHGGIAGLVTLEDALEEIIGEIEDEHDIRLGQNIYPKGTDNWEVNALTPIEEFNRYFGTDLNDRNVETIGGLITLKLQHVPRTDDELVLEDLRVKVLHAQQRRAELLRVSSNLKPIKKKTAG